MDINYKFNSHLSLQPILAVLKRMIDEDRPGAKKLFGRLLTEIESKPELLQTMDDPEALLKNTEPVEALLAVIFPPSTSFNQGVYAISFPFRKETIYASSAFKKHFLKDGSNTIELNDSKTKEEIKQALFKLAYDLILKKFYSVALPATTFIVHEYTDKESGLTKYFELRFNAQFVDVERIDESYTLPESFSPQRTLSLDELEELFPLENFEFNGLMIHEVIDVTQRQVIIQIKNLLININSFSDVSIYDEIQRHVQSLTGLKSINTGVTPFFRMNEFCIYAEDLYKNSLLFKHKEVIKIKDKVNNLIQRLFSDINQPVLYETLSKDNEHYDSLLKYYYELGVRSLILCPLKNEEGKLIGLLEIAGNEPNELQFHYLNDIQPAVPYFSLALEKSSENLELQIDKIIKEHFTAVQPAVEWKFTETAFSYFQQRQVSELAKMPNISFDNVYPLYASIDIRNSSTERNKSIQLDLLEQLNMAKDVLAKAAKVIQFPLLNEAQFKIDKHISSVADNLLSDDEMIVYGYLQNDIDVLFKNLRDQRPELKKWIDNYFNALDPQRKVIYQHRKLYEESLTRINDVLDRFIDSEQEDAQEIYPHYFERYVTDGIEFNIYIGQSLSPHRPFNEIYVRNLKLWQLSLLAKAARISNSLEKRLGLPLQTTQLILAHSIPLSISFRKKERKFDVDGAYNIRYEIIKKRIDKVHIKNSEERLTQPGTVSIVYTQQKEMTEYLEFIEFLQNEKVLGETVEHLELEDTQGISGLKAIRVNVNMTNENNYIPKKEKRISNEVNVKI
jgi:hypothetical protein